MATPSTDQTDPALQSQQADLKELINQCRAAKNSPLHKALLETLLNTPGEKRGDGADIVYIFRNRPDKKILVADKHHWIFIPEDTLTAIAVDWLGT